MTIVFFFTCFKCHISSNQDPEKGPVPAFLPFQRSVSADDEPEVGYKNIKYHIYVVYSFMI